MARRYRAARSPSVKNRRSRRAVVRGDVRPAIGRTPSHPSACVGPTTVSTGTVCPTGPAICPVGGVGRHRTVGRRGRPGHCLRRWEGWCRQADALSPRRPVRVARTDRNGSLRVPRPHGRLVQTVRRETAGFRRLGGAHPERVCPASTSDCLLRRYLSLGEQLAPARVRLDVADVAPESHRVALTRGSVRRRAANGLLEGDRRGRIAAAGQCVSDACVDAGAIPALRGLGCEGLVRTGQPRQRLPQAYSAANRTRWSHTWCGVGASWPLYASPLRSCVVRSSWPILRGEQRDGSPSLRREARHPRRTGDGGLSSWRAASVARR